MRLNLLWSAILRHGLLTESARDLRDLRNTIDPLGNAKDATTGAAVPPWSEIDVLAAMTPYIIKAANKCAKNSKANRDDLTQLGRLAIIVALRSNEASTQRDITSWLYTRAYGAMLHGYRGKYERLMRGIAYQILQGDAAIALQRLKDTSDRLQSIGYGDIINQLAPLAALLVKKPQDTATIAKVRDIYNHLKASDMRILGTKTGLYGAWGTPHDKHKETWAQYKRAKPVHDDDGKSMQAVDALLADSDPERHTDAVDQLKHLIMLASQNGGRAFLNQREIDVLRRTFGLGGQEAVSGARLAKELGVSEQRIVQIVQNAIKKLRDAAGRG